MAPVERGGEQICLVTGAAGFIGSLLAERLVAGGARVVGIDNFDPFYGRATKEANLAALRDDPAFELIEADCSSQNALAAALADRHFDVIIHLAAKAGVRPSIQDPLAYTQANVIATNLMLEQARRRGIGRFVFGSSSSVYGNNPKVPFSETDDVSHPISPYAATKRACELMCQTYSHLFGISTIALRFFTVYGPRQRPDLAIRKFTAQLLNGDTIPMYGAGETERDYTWIDDILQGVEAAIEWTAANPGRAEIVNLGESRTTSLAQLIELLGAAVGVEPRIERLPPQPGDVRRTFADTRHARELLGYRPTTPVEVGIPRFVDWARSQHRLGIL